MDECKCLFEDFKNELLMPQIELDVNFKPFSQNIVVGISIRRMRNKWHEIPFIFL